MAKENIYLCTLTWVAFNCTLRGVAIWSLNKKCHPLLTRWRWNREPKMWSIQMHIIPAAGFFQWCLHIKTEFRPKKVTKQLPKVLNIACPPPSSNRPISRASDWPIFSCLGSSRWKTLAASRRPTTLIRIQPTPTRSVTNQTYLHCKLQPSWFRSTEPPHTYNIKKNLWQKSDST